MASVNVDALVSLHGRALGMDPRKGFLIANGLPITSNAVDAIITVAAAVSTTRNITVQLNNADGTPIAHCQQLIIDVLADSAGAAWATTGGSTGIAIGASGSLLTLSAKKRFAARTTAAGLLALTWTDNASEVAYLGVILPHGRTVISTALTI